MLYPQPKKTELKNEYVFLNKITVSGPCADTFAEAARLFDLSAMTEWGDAAVVLSVDGHLDGIDAYEIEITDEKITLRGKNEDAIARGVWTLVSLFEKTDNGVRIPLGKISDSAYKSFRGIHLFTPSTDAIEDCKSVIAAAARLKYNIVFIEIGGGMQYDKHPEVNKAWVKFCREARNHVGGPQGLQGSQAYWKDSTHVELSGGGYITKAQMREIVDYCRLLHMEVIPEIQSLSHAYYLTLADKSIAERPFEEWPDSYCPSNPHSYELYEDCAEEIIEVIHPKRVSIGHDEVRILGECPLCKGKSGAELLAGDINKLHAFYKKHGIQIMMWGEKLQNFMNFKGWRMGGVKEGDFTDRYGRAYHLDATDGAIDMIPNDIIMLDWYYSWGYDTEKDFLERGITEIYGNFRGSLIADWDTRSKIENVIGAEVSTWCPPTVDDVGYNGWFYEFAFSSAVLWRDDFCDEKRDAWSDEAENMLPVLRRQMTGGEGFNGDESSLTYLTLSKSGDKKTAKACGVQPSVSNEIAEKLAENGLRESDSYEIMREADSLVFFHAADNTPKDVVKTWYFLDPAPRMPVSYSVDYDDGLTIRIPVMFPQMIGVFDSTREFTRPVGDENVSLDVDDTKKAKVSNLSPLYAQKDVWRATTVYFCRSAALLTDDGEKTVYAYEWKNPRPAHKILRVRVIDEGCSKITAHLYGVGTVK